MKPSPVPVVPWSQLAPRLRWQQGEHVTMVGPTGQGKTTLLKALLPMRQYTAVMATKVEDPSLDALRRQGYKLLRAWPPKAGDERVLLWPRIEQVSDLPVQRAVMQHALASIYAQGGWCVALDEARYISGKLQCADLLELLWLQGRSNNISVVAATQRPRWLPLEAFSQATHLFLWRSRDKYDRDRIAGLGTLDTNIIRDTLAQLPKFTCLYLNTRDDFMCITRAPR